MQLFEMSDKKHMVRCSFKSHNSSKVRQKIRAMVPINCVFFLNATTFRVISGRKQGVNIKKSQ